jgi:hypothetical protein
MRIFSYKNQHSFQSKNKYGNITQDLSHTYVSIYILTILIIS